MGEARRSGLQILSPIYERADFREIAEAQIRMQAAVAHFRNDSVLLAASLIQRIALNAIIPGRRDRAVAIAALGRLTQGSMMQRTVSEAGDGHA